MKGLLIKDFKLMLMQKNFFIIIIVVACLISISSQDPTFMIGFITLILSLFTVSTISYDEFDNGYPFLLTLPFSRKTYVLEKYVYGLILGTGAWIVSVMICSLMLIVQGKPVTSDMLIGAFVILPMFLVIESLMIPVHLRFGGEKGRYALIACVGVLVVIGFVVMKIVEIFHIGSTAVPGLKSEPIIDIMISVKPLEEVDKKHKEFENIGYEYLGELGIK